MKNDLYTDKKSNNTMNSTKFQVVWENEYFVTNTVNNAVQCMICDEQIYRRGFNIKRHFNTKHLVEYGGLSDTNKKAMVANVKIAYNLRKSATTSQVGSYSSHAELHNLLDSKGKLKASFLVSHSIAVAKKPFSDGEYIKNTMLKVLECFGETGNVVKTMLMSVPLSASTITRRIETIGAHFKSVLKEKLQSCLHFSLALDESTDITDVSQLLIFVRCIDEEGTVHEELLRCVSMRGTTKGKDIFDAVVEATSNFVPLTKLSAVCTDGAPAMKGIGVGFVGQLQKNGINVPNFHCIIHQEALCAKSVQLSDTMTTVTKIVNKIRGGHASLTHRQFKAFLEEFDTAYADLKLYCEVRWLSRGECLLRFFMLRKEVLEFLKDHVKNSEKLQSLMNRTDFLPKLAFLTDITQLLNTLNKKLQTKGQLIFEMVSAVDGFIKKLIFLKSKIAENDCSLFQCCNIIREENADTDFSTFVVHFDFLIEEFQSRFNDFSEIRAISAVFYNPLTCDVNEVQTEFCLEIIEMQCDLHLKAQNAVGLEFWKLVPIEKYPKVKNKILQMCSYFGSTYICESTFSTMKALKTDYRNRLSEAHLNDFLIISSTKFEIDFDKILN